MTLEALKKRIDTLEKRESPIEIKMFDVPPATPAEIDDYERTHPGAHIIVDDIAARLTPKDVEAPNA